MAQEHDDHDGVSRRHALAWVTEAGRIAAGPTLRYSEEDGQRVALTIC